MEKKNFRNSLFLKNIIFSSLQAEKNTKIGLYIELIFILFSEKFYLFVFFLFQTINCKNFLNLKIYDYYRFIKKETLFFLNQGIPSYKITKVLRNLVYSKIFKNTINFLFYFFYQIHIFPFFLKAILTSIVSKKKKKKIFSMHFFQIKNKIFPSKFEKLFYHNLRSYIIRIKDLKTFFYFTILLVIKRTFGESQKKFIQKKKKYCFFCIFSRLGSCQNTLFISKILLKIFSIFWFFFKKKKTNCTVMGNNFFNFFSLEFIRGHAFDKNWKYIIYQFIKKKKKIFFLSSLDNFFPFFYSGNFFYFFFTYKNIFIKSKLFYNDISWINFISRFYQVESNYDFRKKKFYNFNFFFNSSKFWPKEKRFNHFRPRFIYENFFSLGKKYIYENSTNLICEEKKKLLGLSFALSKKKKKCHFLINRKNSQTESFSEKYFDKKKEIGLKTQKECQLCVKKIFKKKIFLYDFHPIIYFFFFYHPISLKLSNLSLKVFKNKFQDSFLKMFHFRFFFFFFFSKTFTKILFPCLSQKMSIFFDYLKKIKKKLCFFFFLTVFRSSQNFYFFPKILNVSFLSEDKIGLNFNLFDFFFKKNQVNLKLIKSDKKIILKFLKKVFLKKNKFNFYGKKIASYEKFNINQPFYFFGQKNIFEFYLNQKNSKKNLPKREFIKKNKFYGKEKKNFLKKLKNKKKKTIEKIFLYYLKYWNYSIKNLKNKKNSELNDMLNLILNDKICFRNSSLKSLLLFLRSGFLFFYTLIIFPNRIYFIMYLLVYIKLFNKTISFFKKITTNFKVCKPYILFRSQQVSIKSLIFWKFSENKIFFLSSLFTQININLFFNFIFHSDFSSNVFKIKKSDNILYFRKKKEKFTDKQIRLWRCFFLFNCSEHFTKNFQKVKFPKIYLKLTAYKKMMNGFNPNDIIFIEKKNNLDFKTKNKISDCFLKFYKKKNTKVVSIYFLIFYTLIFYLGFFFDHFYLFIGSKNDPAFRKKLRLFSDEIQRVFFLIKNILILKKFGNFILLFFEKASKKNSNNKNKTYFYFTFGEKLKKMSSCFFSRSKGKISFFPDFFVNKIVSVKTFLKKNFKILSRSSFKTLIKLKFVTWLVLFFKFPNDDFVFFSKCFSSKALSYIKNLSKFKLIFLFDKKNSASASIFFLNMNLFSKNTFI